MAFTAAEKLAAVERELEMRRRVYPRLVDRGQTTQTIADRQIALFEAIVADYREQVQRERLL